MTAETNLQAEDELIQYQCERGHKWERPDAEGLLAVIAAICPHCVADVIVPKTVDLIKPFIGRKQMDGGGEE